MADGERGEYVYHHPSFDMGMKIDVSNIGEVLELLDESDRA